MADHGYPFQHFPLTPSGEHEHAWFRHDALSAIRELIHDPHEWLRKSDRAPEQIFGRGKDALLLQFLYPTHGPAPGVLLVQGIVDSNILNVYLPPTQDKREDLHLFERKEEVEELAIILHAGLALAAHSPFHADTADRGLDLLARIIQNPAAYFHILNDDTRFRLVLTAPQNGATVNSGNDLPANASLTPPLHSLTGLRFLYPWREGIQTSLHMNDACIRLTGSYDPEADGDVVEIQVDTLSFAPEPHPMQFLPPPAPVVRKPGTYPPKKEDPSPEKE